MVAADPVAEISLNPTVFPSPSTASANRQVPLAADPPGIIDPLVFKFVIKLIVERPLVALPVDVSVTMVNGAAVVGNPCGMSPSGQFHHGNEPV